MAFASVQVGAGVVADAVAVAVVATGVGVSSFGFFVAVAVEEGGGVDVALAVTLGVGEAPVGDGVTEGVVLGSKITKGGKTRPDPESPMGVRKVSHQLAGVRMSPEIAGTTN